LWKGIRIIFPKKLSITEAKSPKALASLYLKRTAGLKGTHHKKRGGEMGREKVIVDEGCNEIDECKGD